MNFGPEYKKVSATFSSFGFNFIFFIGAFGSQQQSSSIFGGQQSTFGSTAPSSGQTSSVFGAKPAFGTPATFGAAPNPTGTASVFGQSQPQQSTFGSAAPSSGQTSVFGSANPAASSSVFGATATTATPFGGVQSTPQTAATPFGAVQSTPQQTSSVFGTPATQQVFGGGQSSNPIFGGKLNFFAPYGIN